MNVNRWLYLISDLTFNVKYPECTTLIACIPGELEETSIYTWCSEYEQHVIPGVEHEGEQLIIANMLVVTVLFRSTKK